MPACFGSGPLPVLEVPQPGGHLTQSLVGERFLDQGEHHPLFQPDVGFELLAQLPKRLLLDTPTVHLIVETHREPPDAGVLHEHLRHRLVAQQPCRMDGHDRQEHLFLFTEVGSGILPPELQESPGDLLRTLLSGNRLPEPPRVHQPPMVVVGELSERWVSLHPYRLLVSLRRVFSPTVGFIGPRRRWTLR